MWLAQTYDYTYNVTTTELNGAAAGWFAGAMLIYMFVIFGIAIVAIIAMWKIFVKAKQPGWAAIIPIYNLYILLKIIGRPAWWLWLLILLVIPFVNFIGGIVWLVLGILIALDLGKAFGKDPIFSIFLLWLFSIIGLLILGFGDAKYVGPPNKTTTS